MGLAHLDSGDASRDELTGGGQIMGTVDYMAPEQAIDAHSADGRADIYSLGATLWYLLAGESMLAGRTIAEKLLAHQSGSIPSLANVCPGMPEPVKTIFRRMVAKRPEERYQTMAEVIADLESLRGSVADLPAAATATPQAGPLAEFAVAETLAAPQVDTKSMSPSRPAEAGTARRPPWWRGWRKLAAAGAGGLLLIWLGIWVVIRDERGQEVGRVRLPNGGSVTQELETSSPRPGSPGRGAGDEGAWNLPPNAPPPAIAPFDSAQAKSHQDAWAKYLSVPVEMANSLGMRFVLIPPGESDMGSTDAVVANLLEKAKSKNIGGFYIERLPSEAPKHRVRITKPFWLGRHEVTRGQFRRFVDDSGYRTEAERDGKGGRALIDGQLKRDPRLVWNRDLGFEQADNYPVVNVTWNDVTEFCAWLSEKEGEKSHLPSEAQWEYACLAGTTTPWYSVDNEEALKEYGWFISHAEGKSQPVGQKTPNAWGLYDMHGNVWEWCADWYDPAYYATSPRHDPAGPAAGPYHVPRSGSWANAAGACQAAYRCGWQEAGGRADSRGFRIARQFDDEGKGMEGNGMR